MENQVGLEDRVLQLESALGMTRAAKLQQLIAEIEAALAPRAEERLVLWTATRQWVEAFESIRAERKELDARELATQRGSYRDQAALEAHSAETRRLEVALATLQAEQAQDRERQDWPIVRARPMVGA